MIFLSFPPSYFSVLSLFLFHVFPSFSDNHAEGGVVTMVRRAGASEDLFVSNVIIPGRVLRVSFVGAKVGMQVWNIHNHD